MAIIEGADRMNEDAQSALLKTLEEPPAGVTIVLCADDEDAAPADRPVALRPPPARAGRRARHRGDPRRPRRWPTRRRRRGSPASPAGGPGLALAYARAPEAVLIRGELTRILLDLLGQGPAARLVAMREAIPQAMTMAAALDAGMAAAQASGEVATDGKARRPGKRGSTAAGAAVPAATAEPADVAADASGDEALEPAEPEAEAVSGRKVPASARRRAAEILVSVWIDLARDLALAGSGGLRSVRDPDLIEELTAAAAALPDGAAAASLAGTERAATLLANNASPELVLDVLALDWPRRRRAA